LIKAEMKAAPPGPSGAAFVFSVRPGQEALPMSAHITPSVPQDNLNDLADRIRAELQAAKTAWHNALGHALNVGQALLDAQLLVSGNWKRWLRDNCSLSVSTAQLYQQLARHRDEIEAEISRTPELSLRAARRLISKPKVAATDRRTATRAGAAAAPDPAAAKFASTLTKALRTALSLQRSEKSPTPALVGILAKLGAKHLDLHDIAIVVRPNTRARPRRRAA
jgi:hypothetical protein